MQYVSSCNPRSTTESIGIEAAGILVTSFQKTNCFEALFQLLGFLQHSMRSSCGNLAPLLFFQLGWDLSTTMQAALCTFQHQRMFMWEDIRNSQRHEAHNLPEVAAKTNMHLAAPCQGKTAPQMHARCSGLRHFRGTCRRKRHYQAYDD